MTLTDEDYAVINRALEAVYATRSPDEFIICTMRILPTLMNSDMAAYNEVDYAARRMTTLIDSADAQVHWPELKGVSFSTTDSPKRAPPHSTFHPAGNAFHRAR
ncbi:MAG: hypothetical protein NXI27_00290 [Alphaproteobacteria bacterium]|nr:hypothetical protein [Alphaproteobacteria bacterium]